MQEKTLQEYIKQNGFTYQIETYGCQMNAHDSEKIAGILQQMGYQPAKEKQDADLILFNTCCVRENAERKVFGNVGALKQRKRQKKNLVIGVCGCMMQEEGAAEKLLSTFPFVDLVFGTHNMQELPEMLYSVLIEEKKELHRDAVHDSDLILPMQRGKAPVASVDIMQGCENFCTYCIVPFVRGKEQSRRSENILQEIRELKQAGYREVLLLGQNVNSYGKTTPGECSFPQLLARIAQETGIDRIRFMTSHPKDASVELFETMAKYPNICNQLHLPVQSGSSRILQQMNRKYTREEYLQRIRLAKEIIPDLTVTTDLIVGFPGETEEDFAATMSLLNEVQYDAAYTFVYSVRKGTKAATMPDQISQEEKQKRIVQLVALQNKITFSKNKAQVGKQERILVEKPSSRSNTMCGKTEGGRMVNFPGDASLIGRFINVRITEAKKTTLCGEILS